MFKCDKAFSIKKTYKKHILVTIYKEDTRNNCNMSLIITYLLSLTHFSDTERFIMSINFVYEYYKNRFKYKNLTN